MARPASNARERVLSTAARQLCRLGAAQVTLDSVASEAGCAKGLLNYHFDSRDRLLARSSSRSVRSSAREKPASSRIALMYRRRSRSSSS